MKHVLTILFLALVAVLLIGASPVYAENPSLEVYFFWGDGCPHCAKEEIFLDTLEQEFGDAITILRYEVWYNTANQQLLQQKAADVGEHISGVPATFIGNNVIVGFDAESTTGESIRELVRIHLQQQVAPVQEPVTNQHPVTEDSVETAETVSVPLLGDIDPSAYSLFGLTAIIAAVDGFNPCAMWVLVLLIGLLIGMHDRKRLWLLGTLFIFVSGLMYFLFLSAWLSIFQFIGSIRILQIAIGVFAFGAGVYYIRRFFTEKPGECKVTNLEQKRKIIERMKGVVRKRSLLLAGLGIIVLAGMVNTIELVCSAGLPAIYTHILSLSDLPGWQHYLYLILYVFIFMLDDVIVFAIAVTTLKAASASGKFSHVAGFVGGIVILLLGILLIVKPAWIFFG